MIPVQDSEADFIKESLSRYREYNCRDLGLTLYKREIQKYSEEQGNGQQTERY